MIVEITSTLEWFSTQLTIIAWEPGGDLGRNLGGDLGMDLGKDLGGNLEGILQ